MMAPDEENTIRLRVIGGSLPVPTNGTEMYLAAVFEILRETLVQIESLASEMALMRASQPPAERASLDETAGANNAITFDDGPNVLARSGTRRRKDSVR
jgi:hypothetical protein